MEVWLAWVLGASPVLSCVVWWWNEIWFAAPIRKQLSGTATILPPGHMGFPFFGEMFSFLYYFKILRRPEDFINSKRRMYGDGEGIYRTHLFGSPSIIACFPDVNKFVFKSDDVFIMKWPNVETVGSTSLVAVEGKAHTRLKRFITNAVNHPDALRRIALLVQPGIAAALNLWAQMGRINAYDQTKKVTFENIGKLFVSFEPGHLLDTIDELFQGLVKGIRAIPLNFPGTAYHHSLQCRKKLEAIFRVELEKKKNRNEEKRDDLMDGLMQIKDDEGNKLSDQEVLDNIVSLVFAGYESTALSSMWAIYCLAKYPNVLMKLREESLAISQNKEGEFITYEDVAKMKYTNKVVEETIRMANVAPVVFRMATKDVDYKGYRIPKGWKVILWVRYLHTDPENFDDPMCFNPDRWNGPARPGTYQVFGGGSRLCAGNMLAKTQLAIFLHHLSIGYKWELLNPDAHMSYLAHPKPADGVEVEFSKI